MIATITVCRPDVGPRFCLRIQTEHVGKPDRDIAALTAMATGGHVSTCSYYASGHLRTQYTGEALGEELGELIKSAVQKLRDFGFNPELIQNADR